MARLDELSFSLQCLPNNYEDPFKYNNPETRDHQSQETIDPMQMDSQNQVDDLNKSGDSLLSGANGVNASFQQSTTGNEMEDPVSNVVDEAPKEAISQQVADEATNNFDTSFLGDEPQNSEDTQPLIQHQHPVNIQTRVQDPPPPPPPLQPQPNRTTNVIVTDPIRKTKKAINLACKVKKKAFTCEHCQQTFYTNESLIAHERAAHQGIKPFSCDLCNDSFNSKHNLILHKRSHTGEKPHKCSICKQHNCRFIRFFYM